MNVLILELNLRCAGDPEALFLYFMNEEHEALGEEEICPSSYIYQYFKEFEIFASCLLV
jgi:hypothetical protein